MQENKLDKLSIVRDASKDRQFCRLLQQQVFFRGLPH